MEPDDRSPQKPSAAAPRSKLKEALLLSIGSLFLMVIFLIAGFFVLGVLAVLLPFVLPPGWLATVLTAGLAIVLFGAAFFVLLPVAMAWFGDPLGAEPDILIDAAEPPLGGLLAFEATQAFAAPCRVQSVAVSLECCIRVVRGRNAEDLEDRFTADRWEALDNQQAGPGAPLRFGGSLKLPGEATVAARRAALAARAGAHRDVWVDWDLVYVVQGTVPTRLPLAAAGQRVGRWHFPLWR